jgi:Protein of unknown function (DUF1559)/BlaR1 peptidase M56
MNPIASTILWMSVQIALFSVVGFLALMLLRRRGPNAAAACCATVLGLTLPLAILVVCPWPRWSISAAAKPPVSDRGLNGDGENAIVAAAGKNRTDPTTAVSAASDSSPSSLAIWWQSATDWFRAGGQQQTADVSTRATWQTYLPWLLAAGVGVCLVRLAAGVWGVNRLQRQSRPIVDADLLRTIHEISATIQCEAAPGRSTGSVGDMFTLQAETSAGTAGRASSGTQEHITLSPAQHDRPTRSSYVPEVRETANLRSAATIGWRRPVLLLPSDWRSWTETERRVVLAHELAHVARRDYLAAVIARVATSIHFYQPLVLWLSRQLRIQQELAADSHAAAIAGGRQTYLTTLAQMALRADDQPLPWAARAFLPGTSMLIKRVAWLKQKGDQKEMTMNQKTRWILAVAMAAMALFIAGIRGPGASDSTLAVAAPPQAAEKTDQFQPRKFELGPVTLNTALRTFDYIPEDAKFVMAISPSALLKFQSMQQLQKIADNAEFDKKFGLPLNEIEDVKVIQTSAGNPFESSPRPPFQRLVIRSVKPHDWKKWISEKPGVKPKQIGDKTIYEIVGEGSVYVPDDRTLVVVFVPDEVEMKKIIFGAEKLHSEEPNSFPSLLYSPFAVWADTKSIKAELEKPGVPLDPSIVMIRSMLEHTNSASLSASLYMSNPNGTEEHVNAGLLLTCDSDEAAKQSAALLGATRTLLQTFTSTAENLASDSIEKMPADQRKLAEIKISLVREASRILEKVELKSDGDKATATADFVIPPKVISSLLEPAVIASREAAMRAQGMNNLKQIGLAMFNYLTVNKHFPPAAIRDKDGKPLLSWRVAILPFIEQQALYNEFHLDEPWDSERNKPLIAKMPVVFRDPHEAAASTNASYFMPTGPGTIGENPKGTAIKNITDGTSHTIMLIEAKRDIPWTKPEDIEIDSDTAKPLPKFGGHMLEGLFIVGLADGSVHGMSAGVDPDVLRSLFMIASGQPKIVP